MKVARLIEALSVLDQDIDIDMPPEFVKKYMRDGSVDVTFNLYVTARISLESLDLSVADDHETIEVSLVDWFDESPHEALEKMATMSGEVNDSSIDLEYIDIVEVVVE